MTIASAQAFTLLEHTVVMCLQSFTQVAFER
jgi:hypothetical protein